VLFNSYEFIYVFLPVTALLFFAFFCERRADARRGWLVWHHCFLWLLEPTL